MQKLFYLKTFLSVKPNIIKVLFKNKDGFKCKQVNAILLYIKTIIYFLKKTIIYGSPKLYLKVVFLTKKKVVCFQKY